MPVMWRNHKVLFRDGKVAMSEDCCCTTCQHCDEGGPSELLATLADVVLKTDCCDESMDPVFKSTKFTVAPDDVNGEYTLEWQEDCVWLYQAAATGTYTVFDSDDCTGDQTDYELTFLNVQYVVADEDTAYISVWYDTDAGEGNEVQVFDATVTHGTSRDCFDQTNIPNSYNACASHVYLLQGGYDGTADVEIP